MPPRRPPPRRPTAARRAGGTADWSPVSTPPAAGTDTAAGEAIVDWYATAARDLPWRRPGVDAWAVLVSEVMLQQPPVARVLPAYAAWLERWPTPEALA